jgi:uncharacterized alkaline shock family protein YloU
LENLDFSGAKWFRVWYNSKKSCTGSDDLRPGKGIALAEKRNIYTIYDDNTLGTVQISDSVLAVITALAATEPEGIASIREGLSGDQISRSGMKALAKSVKVTVDGNNVTAQLVLNMKYGYNIPETTKQVQEKVKDVLENMTGFNVVSVHVSIADIEMPEQKKSRTKQTK